MAFFCTDPNASVAEILEAVADRAAIEQNFHDVKEVHGAGQQQVRNYWANIAVPSDAWVHTLIELWAWNKPAKGIFGDRSDSPWDDADRRPLTRIGATPCAASAWKRNYRVTHNRRACYQKILAFSKRLAQLAA